MLVSLLLVPIITIIIIIASYPSLYLSSYLGMENADRGADFSTDYAKSNLGNINLNNVKLVALTGSILNLILSLCIFITFDFSENQFQFVQQSYQITDFHLFLGLDGISIYFVLLTTIIMPVALLSNWTSITDNVKTYLVIVLLLETLLLAVFMVLDILLFYVFFESILPPLFLLIGVFGSKNKIRASFYLFLYTLLGSLFMLISILGMYSIMGSVSFDSLFKVNFDYSLQTFLFYGIFIAFAVKTPTIFLNVWLLKAHVESPLAGSIILAGNNMPAYQWKIAKMII